MRVSVNIRKNEKELINKLSKEPLLRGKKTVVRTAIALGLSKMVDNPRLEQSIEGDENFRFNSKTVDPEGIFEVMAYYVIAARMGATVNNKKMILASKDELTDTIGEAFILGLKQLPEFKWM